MLRADPPLQSRHGQINPRIFEGKNAVSRAAFIHRAELRRQRMQLFRRKAVDLAVDIRAFPPKQRVAHAAADQHRPAAHRLRPQRDLPNRFPLNLFCHSTLSVTPMHPDPHAHKQR